MRRIYLNEDNAHFYSTHPASDMTIDGLQHLVDTYAVGTQVAGIMFCVNVQRALFDSRSWEALYLDYDPKAGSTQSCLAWLPLEDHELALGSQGRQWLHNLWLLRERGIDHPQVWLDRCRYHNIEGWLSMRMNDCHYNDIEDAFWHSSFWVEHPELRRAPNRPEVYLGSALDYGHAEVREHHLAFIRELFERYDMFGLELDWMRWGTYFAPGEEQAGLAKLNEFVCRVRELATWSARRVGHPIQVAVRIPAEPASCLALGMDVITWAKEKWIDVVILSSFLGCANLDYPITIWRRVLGDDIRLLTHVESCVDPYPEANVQVLSYEILYAAAASALQRGADGVYLFNECYRESDEPEVLHQLLTHAGSPETLSQVVRRHVVSYPQVHAPGESVRAVLPIRLQLGPDAQEYARTRKDLGRMTENITLRIDVGSIRGSNRALLHLGFSHNVADDLASLTVYVNGQPIHSGVPLPFKDIAHNWKRHMGLANYYPSTVGPTAIFALTPNLLLDGNNTVEFVPPSVGGTLEWAEITVYP